MAWNEAPSLSGVGAKYSRERGKLIPRAGVRVSPGRLTIMLYAECVLRHKPSISGLKQVLHINAANCFIFTALHRAAMPQQSPASAKLLSDAMAWLNFTILAGEWSLSIPLW